MKIFSEIHQNRIAEIYRQYRDEVFPLVGFIESLNSKFPVSILNEIRSIFSHFSRVYETSMNDDEISTELTKAENHLKRVVLDCYKFGCLALEDFYENFRKEYIFADLAVIDNGDFLSQITQNFAEAKKLRLEAKASEQKNKHADELYKEFENSFKMFLLNYKLINSKIALVHKVAKKARWARFWGTFGFWISLAFAIASVVLAIL